MWCSPIPTEIGSASFRSRVAIQCRRCALDSCRASWNISGTFVSMPKGARGMARFSEGSWAAFVARLVVLLGVLVVLAGCVGAARTVRLDVAFDPVEAARIHETGRAKVSGEAFARLLNGKILRAVGSDVYLIPRTAYADAWFQGQFGPKKAAFRGVNFENRDPRYADHMRHTIASSGGRFTFEGVPNGEYYIFTQIPMPSDYIFYQFAVMERVVVNGGKSVRVVMRGY